MKKSIILIAVATLGLTTSCRKELTCSCDFTITSIVVSGNTTNTSISTYATKQKIDKMSKKDARQESTCYDYKNVNTYSTGSGSLTTNYTENTDASCKLK